MKAQRAATIVAIGVVLAAAPRAVSDTDPIDAYIAAEMAARRIPGLALAVARDGAIVRTSYYGLANVELGVPVGERSVFAIASLDKQLTAAGLMRLVEMGKVSLDDRVDKYVDGPWDSIRVRHLLSHTSGLPDQVAGSLEGRAAFTYTTDQLLATVRTLERVDPPGERFLYSDANFFLAQLVTERASGRSWREFIGQEIFTPAGMTGATFMDAEIIRPGRVSPYTLDRTGTLLRNPSRDIDYGPLYNDLGMTVRDFASWLLALDTDRPLAASTRETMWTPARLSDGSVATMSEQWRHYGFGFGLDEVFGRRVVLHSGFVGVGYVKFPEERLSVVVFTNLRHGAGSDPIGLAYGVAGFYAPAVSFLAREPVASDRSDPRTAALRNEYERLLAGEPGAEHWAPVSRRASWEAAAGLASRMNRLGSLLAFEPLGVELQPDGAQRALFRARHERGRVFVRVGLNAAGSIVELQWYHV